MFFITLCTHRPNLDHLRKQIESIRAQTWASFRCLISDDASPPETYRQICALAAHDSRFYTRRHPHHVGAYENFEASLYQVAENAHWVCYCDQEDVWLPRKLELQAAVLVDPSVSLCYTDLSAIDEQGQVITPSLFQAEQRNVHDHSVAQLILRNPVSGCTAAFRRSLVHSLLPFPRQGTKPLYHHDQWTALQATQAGRMVAIREPLVQFRQAERRASASVPNAFSAEWQSREDLIDTVLSRAHPNPHADAKVDALRYWTGSKIGSLHLLRFAAEQYQHYPTDGALSAKMLLGKLSASGKGASDRLARRLLGSRLLGPVRDRLTPLRDALRRRVAERAPRLLGTLAPAVWCRYREVVPLAIDPTDRRLCLFAHFDADNRVEDYVFHHLGELQRAGTDIVFVTTSKLSPGDIARLEPLCVAVIERENVGIDFGSWRTALLIYPRLLRARVLLFANDSVYGPLHPIAPILSRFEAKDCDFFGITENLEFQSHYQSYFIGFKASCLHSRVFEQFVSKIELLPDKLKVIVQYEVAMKSFLEAGGLRGAVLFPASAPADNPLHRTWRELIERGAPYLKVELLRDNPRKCAIDSWPEVVRARGFDPALIEQHLRRIMQQRGDRTT